MTKCIAVINGGSSSIKFSLFLETDTVHLDLICCGQAEGIGVSPRLSAVDAQGNTVFDDQWENRAEVDHSYLMDRIIQSIGNRFKGVEIVAVGHRVVHGGTRFSTPVVVNDEVLKILEQYIPLAPLHQPHNLASIRTIGDRHPGVIQVACFDTAFHSTIPAVGKAYALPRALSEEGVRRYGFHGLSYEYISMKLKQMDTDMASGRIIVAHLGSGASMCAMYDGKSVASTLGFSALDGLPMGTRTGNLDPGVVLYLMQAKGMSVSEIETLLYKESGLLGVSQISNDMRFLLESDDPRAQEAVDLFIYRVNRELGSLTAALGGLDALVFTAGIGERSPDIREKVCQAAAWTGICLDHAANRNGVGRISTEDSTVSTWVIPTNEELMIAKHTLALITGKK